MLLELKEEMIFRAQKKRFSHFCLPKNLDANVTTRTHCISAFTFRVSEVHCIIFFIFIEASKMYEF